MRITGNQFVIPVKEGWIVKGQFNVRISFKSSSKEEAINRAFEIAKNQKTKVYLKHKNGKFKLLIPEECISIITHDQYVSYEAKRERPFYVKDLSNFYD